MDFLDKIKEEIDKCIKCEICMEKGVCPSFTIKENEVYSPLGRLNALMQVLNDKITNNVEVSLLTCNACARCTEICPLNIKIGELVNFGRNILYKKGLLPKENHKRIIDSIIHKGNAVVKNEYQRYIYKDQYYDKFFNNESDTLLFLGCISSFFYGDVIKSSINILDSLGISFQLINHEGCCGIFLYDGGYFDKAKEVFIKNKIRFESIGINKIITLCPSCFKCFKQYYPRILGDFNIEVFHFVEAVIKELENGKSLSFSKAGSFVLHEPCKLTRFLNIIEEPRIMLNAMKINFSELDENRRMSLCCGAGSGVRAYDMKLALDIGNIILNKALERDIVTLCPFCKMNLLHSAKQNHKKIKVSYISEIFIGNGG